MSTSMFTSITEIKSNMTMEVLVGPRPYKKIIVDAIPVGIDRGHHCHGALIYKITNSNDLVMYDDNCFYRLHGAQYDDIETTDGMQFCFADDGEYGICNFHIPEGIRKRNVFIKGIGVIQWEEALYYNWDWFEEDRRIPHVYQWNPRTDSVREVYHNGTFSGWHEYVIENNYRAKLIIDDLFDDKYAGLIEWALAQPDEPEDDYSDISAEYEECYEAVGRELDEYEPDYSDIIERYERWDALRAWAMKQPNEPEDDYSDVAERYERWDRMAQWAKNNTEDIFYEHIREIYEFHVLAKFNENKEIVTELIKRKHDLTLEEFYNIISDGCWFYYDWMLRKSKSRHELYIRNLIDDCGYLYNGREWCNEHVPSDETRMRINTMINDVVIPAICKEIVEYQISMEE